MADLRSWFCTPGPKVVIVDADDTVWFDRRYYRCFLNAMAESAISAGVTAAQFETHIKPHRARQGLSEMEYAAAIETAALELATNDELFLKRVREEVVKFRNHPIELLPGAHETLTKLTTSFRVVIMTQGHGPQQWDKLSRSLISKLEVEFVCVERKNLQTLSLLMKRVSTLSGLTASIGNSVQYDVIPAAEAGLCPIWLNHEENAFGRDARLPSNAIEVPDWFTIRDAF